MTYAKRPSSSHDDFFLSLVFFSSSSGGAGMKLFSAVIGATVLYAIGGTLIHRSIERYQEAKEAREYFSYSLNGRECSLISDVSTEN